MEARPTSALLYGIPTRRFEPPTLCGTAYAWIPTSDITYLESEQLEPTIAYEAWQAARSLTAQTGLFPVLRPQRLEAAHCEVVDSLDEPHKFGLGSVTTAHEYPISISEI